MELRRARKRSVIINLTSLIDVLFLLLIFFMVSTTFVSQPAISLQLPDAKHAEAARQSFSTMSPSNPRCSSRR
jgi:biopolymer transport protein ExbD